jgi:hypothetical protein
VYQFTAYILKGESEKSKSKPHSLTQLYPSRGFQNNSQAYEIEACSIQRLSLVDAAFTIALHHGNERAE